MKSVWQREESEVERYPLPVFVTHSWSCHALLISTPPLFSRLTGSGRALLVFNTDVLETERSDTEKMFATPLSSYFPPSFFLALCLFHLFVWSINIFFKRKEKNTLSALMHFEIVGVLFITERGLCVWSEHRLLKRLYLRLYNPFPPPLRECWLFYQHPNVEFWSNSLCVPNIAAGVSGDVFMTRTLIAARRENVHKQNMVCISNTRPEAAHWNKTTRSQDWIKRTTLKTTNPLSPHCVEDSSSIPTKSGFCVQTQFSRCDANSSLQNKLSLLYVHPAPCQQLEMTSVWESDSWISS